jgi:hypothetical protein
MDRNGTVWHRQANRRAKRYHKSPGTLGRLARWKPLANAYAAKFRCGRIAHSHADILYIQQLTLFWQGPWSDACCAHYVLSQQLHRKV